MNRRRAAFAFAAITLCLTYCASSDKVDMKEPTRLLGRENDVRIDASILSNSLNDEIGHNSVVPFTYEVHNFRQEAIGVADIVADTTFDEETRIITVAIGSEVPGNEFMPRLVAIAPGESKSFKAAARMSGFLVAPRGEMTAWPESLRLKVNYLKDVQPFQKLIGIPETGIHDPKLADSLFTAWTENISSVYTNAVPVAWRGRPRTPATNLLRP